MTWLADDIDAFNADVSKWTKESKADVVSEIKALGIVHRENSPSPVPATQAIKTYQGKKAGVVNKISFKMPRHMVFRHKGVGRGTKITQVGTTSRKPAPWFNPVIEKRMNNLVDIVADHQGAMVLNAIMIK